MGGFLTVVPLLTGLVSAYGGIQQGQAQAASYAAQAQAEKMNAQLAAINADIATSEGKRSQAQAAEAATKAMGRQRAALAETGILNSATGGLLQEQSQREAEEEQLRIGRQTEMEALNYKIQRSNALTSSNILSSNVQASKTGGVLTGIGSILGGTAESYRNYRLYSSGR